MAKAKKVKQQAQEKVEPVIEQAEENIPVVEETPIPEIGEEPPSVTLDEVEEIQIQEPQEEKKEEPEVVRIHNIIGDTIWKYPVGEDLTMEQKILNFIESRQPGEIRMNDFLKSLFPPPKFGEPPLWMNKGESKRLSLLLDDLQKKGYIQFISNTHLKLGQFYHDGDDQRTKHHNLNTVQLIAKK